MSGVGSCHGILALRFEEKCKCIGTDMNAVQWCVLDTLHEYN
jgi:hypothetical protein